MTPQKPGDPIDYHQPAETCVSHVMRPIHELNGPIGPIIILVHTVTRPYISIDLRVITSLLIQNIY